MNISSNTRSMLEYLAITALWPTCYAINRHFDGGIFDLALKLIKDTSPEERLVMMCREKAFINLSNCQRANLDALARRLGVTRKIKLAEITEDIQNFLFEGHEKSKEDDLLEVIGNSWSNRYPAIIRINSKKVLADLENLNTSSTVATNLLIQIAHFKKRSSIHSHQNHLIGLCLHIAFIAGGCFSGKKAIQTFGSYSPFIGLGTGYLIGVLANNALFGLKILKEKRRAGISAARVSTIEELGSYIQKLRSGKSNQSHYWKLIFTPAHLWDDSVSVKIRNLDLIREEKVHLQKFSTDHINYSSHESANTETQEIGSTAIDCNQTTGCRRLRPEDIEMIKAYRQVNSEIILRRIRGNKKHF